LPKILSLLSALVISTSMVYADDTPAPFGAAVIDSHATTSPNGTAGAEMIKLHSRLAGKLMRLERERTARVEGWPLAPAVRGPLTLRRRDVYAPDARLFVIKNGRKTEVPRSRLQFFVGTTEADSFTRVLAWVDPDTQVVRSITQAPSGTYEMLAPSRPGAGQVLARAEALQAAGAPVPDGACANDALDSLALSHAIGQAGGGTAAGAADTGHPVGEGFSALQLLIVAFDTDKEAMSLKFSNNTTTATNYIASLIAATNVMYERDLNIRLLVGSTTLRIGSDPYTVTCSVVNPANGNACMEGLTEFSNYWAANNSGVIRGIAALISGRQPADNFFSGIAWIKGLCSQNVGYSYNQVFRNTNGFISTEAKFIGHEFGHNFGALHTHCSQQDNLGVIDQCVNTQSGCYAGATSCPPPGTYQGFTTPANAPGTVMSYCNQGICGSPGSSAVFHPRTINSIAPYLTTTQNQANSCIKPAALPAASPFGSFDSPTNNATGVQGAIPVTGWALDDTAVDHVEIWRDPVAGETPAANGKVFIANATFVAGARPDVESLYWNYPNANRSAWGYMLLTNMLPNVAAGTPAGGVGTFTLYAYVYDTIGHLTPLGSKTFTCNNTTGANKPFGTIDTPAQGATVSGTLSNFGWVLTPQPGIIPTDGSTIQVFVDGNLLGTAQYDLPRSDIQALFPGYANTDGAIGFFSIDTTTLTNGVHTIFWVVADDHNRTDGIGSRYFTVNN
jgi:hypothetical protein